MATKEVGGPPDGGWGWVVVIASFFNLLIMTSCFTTFTYLYVELLHTYHESQSLIAAIGAIQIAFAYASNIPAGSLVQHFGSRPVAVAGGFLMAVGVVLSSFANGVVMLCLTYGVLAGIGGGLSMLPCFVVAQQYFTSQRALAGGIVVCGLSVSGIIGPPLLRLAIDHFGWRGAMLLHGGIILHTVICASAFRPLPYIVEQQRQQKLKDAEKKLTNTLLQNCWMELNHFIRLKLFANLNYVLWCVGNFGLTLGIMPFYQHVANFCIYKGLSKYEISILLYCLAGASLLCRLLVSILANVKGVNRLLLYTSGGVVSGLLMCFTRYINGFIPLLVYICILGFAFGTVGTIQSTVLVDLIGIQYISQAHGMFSIFLGLCAFAGSPFTGFMVDTYKNYDIPLLVNGCVELFGCTILLIIVVRISYRARHLHKQEKLDTCKKDADAEEQSDEEGADRRLTSV